MDEIYKTREQLEEEFEAARRKLAEIDACRLDLERTRDRYENLLNAAPDAMIFVNADFAIVMVNAQTERLFGYSSDELVGRNLDRLIPERYRQRHKRVTADYMSNPRVRTMGTDLNIFGLRRDGTEFRADISLSPLRTDAGVMVAAAVRDVTERVEAQQQIERNFHIQRVISSVLKMSLEPYSLDDVLARTLDLILTVPYLALQSKGSIYLVEGDPARLVLKAQRGMGEDQLLQCSDVAMGKCLCGRAASECEVVFSDCEDERHEVRFNDSLPHSHYCVPMVAAGRSLGVLNVLVSEGHARNHVEEEFLVAVANTLSMVIESHRHEAEKLQLQARLVQSEKLAALGRISANVAHELRNPLTAIGGFARRLVKGMQAETKEKEYADFIASEVTSLEKVLRSVLSFSRGAALQLGMHNLNSVVADVLMIYDETIAARRITVYNEPGEIPETAIDRDQVKEAVGNILSNAIDAVNVGGGGEVHITTSVESIDSRSHVIVQVRDNGKGMPSEVMSRIYEPFFTTKIAEKGVGLGLAITKKIVEDHSGFITVQSTPGSGTVFALHFPVEQGKK